MFVYIPKDSNWASMKDWKRQQKSSTRGIRKNQRNVYGLK